MAYSANPNNVKIEKRRRVSLPCIARYKRHSDSHRSLKGRQRSDMNGVQRSHRDRESADMISMGVIAEESKSYRRNNETTRLEPRSRTYRLIKALVSK